MGSLGGEVGRKKAMWMYPKMIGANPSERWGHSACYYNGLVYIFGGCRGGVHFSDVLVCNLATMTWSILKTSGPGPGPRDSHSAVLVGRKMLVFGGTNGFMKVNDLHVLDLATREWTRPECRGSPPSARESHTMNVVGDEKLVVFGGSGEGEANKYLNDLHILDLKRMEWSSPEVRGCVPPRRDSHSSVAVGNRLYVFGGDSGDRYQGDISVLDVNNLIWTRLDARGPSPGARAGHAAVSIGTKIYVLGGVGDKQYYSDIWVLDVITSTWAQLDTACQKSQGRFSHTATVTNLGIAVFGGCGEDERPLSELLVLQIDSPTCRAFGNAYKEETEMMLKNAENILLETNTLVENEDVVTLQEVQEVEFVPKRSLLHFSSDMLHPKRRRTSNSKLPESKPEPDEHSLSHSRHSSPSQSDHDQIPVKKSISSSYPSSRVHPMFRQKLSPASCYELNSVPINLTNSKHAISSPCSDKYLSSELPNKINLGHRNVICIDACRCNAAESLSLEAGKCRNLMGAEVHGQVDGAFDSGYLMTATVNGKVFRGVLFAPGPDLASRGTNCGQHTMPMTHQIAVNHASSCQNYSNTVTYPTHFQHPVKLLAPSDQTQSRRSSSENRARLHFENDNPKANSELQGVVLTLASPGSELGKI